MSELARCPCGEIPDGLIIRGYDNGTKYARVFGACCGFWSGEFYSDQLDIKFEGENEKSRKLAIQAWNNAPKGGV